ncbi:DUF808 domain-containing protein [Massilia sp. W12]|uniref:DUF808 domain-containing protein n=1 Tax=Massilia sp. W12 TaxID=3126507 RepID=UPI0030D5DADE
MAGSSLLLLLDDIATTLDDVAVMAKVAAKKTTGVLGDDLALNAEQVAGVAAERELPVVWAVFKGSMINKLILVPLALAINYFAPPLVTFLLMLGGAYLCFEGVEKVLHPLLHKKEEQEQEQKIHAALIDPHGDLVALEKDKIKGAIRTDFILSAEIIVIALGVVQQSSFIKQFGVLSLIAIAMTVGVYGLVALIVKLDDIGLYMRKKPGALNHKVGGWLVAGAPKLMKLLGVVGTIAMFTVGGSILMHGIGPLHHWVEHILQPLGGGFFSGLLSMLCEIVVGVVAGLLVLGLVSVAQKLRPAKTA